MPEQLSQLRNPANGPERGSPLHGFQGDRQRADHPFVPASLTVALSRESGCAAPASRAVPVRNWAGKPIPRKC